MSCYQLVTSQLPRNDVFVTFLKSDASGSKYRRNEFSILFGSCHEVFWQISRFHVSVLCYL